MNALAALAFALAGIHIGAAGVMPIGYAPAWSPDGERIAFVTKGDLWVADADGTHRDLLVQDAETPAWSPNGRRLAYTRQGVVYTIRVDGLDERRLATGAHPTWSPDGSRIAFDRDQQVVSVRWYGGGVRFVTDGEDPAYAPNGRLAVVRDGQIVVQGRVVADGTEPAWSPDGRQLAYVRGNVVYVGDRELHEGAQPAWRPPKRSRELLPDFDQRAPTGLTVESSFGRWLLGFTSLVDNIGLGPSILVGVRPPGHARMIGSQEVLLTNGAVRTYHHVAQFRYTNSLPHYHWHLMRFDSFELRTLDGKLLVRDRKSGFCLADRYGAAPGHWPGRRPHFFGNCGRHHPEATRVRMGTTAGYTDRYLAFFHGQNIDITGLPSGVYVVTHRVNASMQLHELRYDNDAASVRIRIAWARSYPTVRILRSCAATPDC